VKIHEFAVDFESWFERLGIEVSGGEGESSLGIDLRRTFNRGWSFQGGRRQGMICQTSKDVREEEGKRQIWGGN